MLTRLSNVNFSYQILISARFSRWELCFMIRAHIFAFAALFSILFRECSEGSRGWTWALHVRSRFMFSMSNRSMSNRRYCPEEAGMWYVNFPGHCVTVSVHACPLLNTPFMCSLNVTSSLTPIPSGPSHLALSTFRGVAIHPSQSLPFCFIFFSFKGQTVVFYAPKRRLNHAAKMSVQSDLVN